VSGLGVATADGVYGAVAAFGLVAVTEVLTGQAPWLRMLGGLAMVYLGIGAIRTAPSEAASMTSGGGLFRAYGATVGMTLMNPSTILSFVALFAGLGLGGGRDVPGDWTPATLVAGVFLGSALWWLAIAAGLSLARARLGRSVQRGINLVAGLVLIGFGLLAMGSVLV
jgi:threonine/homoserine/homoserine lactone efflux protein